MEKSTKMIVIIVAVLGVAVAVLAYLNHGIISERLALLEEGTFMISSDDTTHHVSIHDLMEIGVHDISASPRGELRTFTGVPIVYILRHFDIDYSEASSVLFLSLDGFATTITIAEALNANNAFVVFEESGELLGAREEGGLGPYMIVMAEDPFPNRWARYLMEVRLQGGN